MSVLQSALEPALNSKGQVILISGELGAGKSRLLREAEKISSPGTVCLSAKCSDKLMLQSYYALGEALDQFFLRLDKLPSEFLKDLSDNHKKALCAFLPVIATLLDFSEENENVDEYILADALIKLLINMSCAGPLRVLIDDAHYIDTKSLEVISYVNQKRQELPFLAIFSYSTFELSQLKDENPAFLGLIKSREADNFININLTGLSLEEVREMTSSLLLNFDASFELSDLVYKITKGNPCLLKSF